MSIRPDPLELTANTLVSRICDVWSAHFDSQPVGPGSNFFALGGDSLAAVSLFEQMERVLGKPVPGHVIFTHPTPRLLSEVYLGDESKLLMPFPRTGPKSSSRILFVPVVGAGVEGFVPLAASLESFTSSGLGGLPGPRLESCRSLEEMVSVYLEECSSYFLQSPQFIVGFSSGGLIAYEMARQLDRAGIATPTVVLLDTYFPGQWKKWKKLSLFRRLILKVSRLMDIFRWSLELELGLRIPYLRTLMKGEFENLGKLGRVLWKRDWAGLVEHLKLIWNPHGDLQESRLLRLCFHYGDPKPYNGKVLLFKARFRTGEFIHEPTLGWREVAESFQEVSVPGTHAHTFLRTPIAEMIASELNRHLIEESHDD